ncbi:MAG: hypothetical protein WC375_00105 [Methanomassiliicoccales archaeon]
MKLVTMMAKACMFAQEHIDNIESWPKNSRGQYLHCVSFQMACFLSQNTMRGANGVECDIILEQLIAHPMKTEKEWRTILNEHAKELGGWKK